METLGHYLKVQRKLRGISLEDVSRMSKVAPNWLELLETNDFDKLPGDIFTKGYLRLYSEVVGLDPDDVLLRYELVAQRDEEAALAPKRWWQRRDTWRVMGLLLGMSLVIYWVVTRFIIVPQWTRHL